MSIDQERLDLAGTRDFLQPGEGPRRRERLAAYNRRVMAELWNAATTTVPVPAQGVALAVVGGVARGDSGPLSDYDLVLLHDGRAMRDDELTKLADRLWYPLWDSGIRLDHSLRTPKECRAVAAGDLAAAVGLLDVDLVGGDAGLVTEVRGSIAGEWRANARKRLPELIRSVRERHERHGGLTTELEPELKEAAGGLRDMAVLRSLAAAWLADRPHGAPDAAYERLLDVRDALHVVTGRGRDRLARQDQDAVAALLGEPDADALLTSVVQAGRVVSFSLEDTMRRAGQSQRARTPRIGPRRPSVQRLGYGLGTHDGEVVLDGRAVRERGPLILLRAAAAAADRGMPIGPATVRNLTQPVPGMPRPWPEEIRDAFVDLLAAGPGLAHVWETLDLAGAIGEWLPEWAPVRSRPQRNAVHRHTVDRHLIETVIKASTLRDRVRRPDLLLVAALLHDIGKVAGAHDHAVEGARVAAKVVARMGFSRDDCHTVELLVREHLTLAELATRRDPRDARTVAAVVAAVEERPDVLDLLGALTEADAVAAGPKAWTGWRAGLIGSLLAGAHAALSGRPAASLPDSAIDVRPITGDLPYVAITPTPSGATIEITDADRPGVFASSARLLANFRLTVRSARVRTIDGFAHNTWQVEAPLVDLPDAEQLVRALRDPSRMTSRPPGTPSARRVGTRLQGAPPPRATVVPDASDDALVLEVRAADRPGLLGDLGETFGRHRLAIRSAHVATYAGQALDTFYLIPAAESPDPPAVARLIAALIDACDGTPAASVS